MKISQERGDDHDLVEEIANHLFQFYDDNKDEETDVTNIDTYITKIDEVPLEVFFSLNTVISFISFQGESKRIKDEDGNSLVLFNLDAL